MSIGTSRANERRPRTPRIGATVSNPLILSGPRFPSRRERRCTMPAPQQFRLAVPRGQPSWSRTLDDQTIYPGRRGGRCALLVGEIWRGGVGGCTRPDPSDGSSAPVFFVLAVIQINDWTGTSPVLGHFRSTTGISILAVPALCPFVGQTWAMAGPRKRY